MQLKGKTALITGASSGIGQSFAYLLAAEGMNSILVARSLAKLETIAQDIEEKHGVAVHVIQQDLSEVDAAKSLYNQVKKDKLEVDLLINNAGFGKWGDFEEFSLEVYRQMIQLNITSLTDLCHLFLPDLKAKPEAGLINVGSTASFLPVPYSAVYSATKTYVLYFTEGLVGELEDTNVTVHCLCPGGTISNFAQVANSEVSVSTEGMKTPDEVAKAGLTAFQAGKHYVVTGRAFSIFLTRILSRKRVINMVRDYWKKLLGK